MSGDLKRSDVTRNIGAGHGSEPGDTSHIPNGERREPRIALITLMIIMLHGSIRAIRAIRGQLECYPT